MKSIAALCMLIDHIGLIFFPDDLRWRMIGRLAMPIFAYGVARGAFYTKSLEEYMKKILLFSFISQIPFWGMDYWAHQEQFFVLKLNVGFTFFLALMSIYWMKKSQEEASNLKAMATSGICILLAQLLHCDYGGYGVWMVWIGYLAFLREKPLYDVAIGYIGLTFLTYGRQISLCLQQSIGVLGYGIIWILGHKSEKRWGKFFYVFYPLHMLILCGIKWWLVYH